jgi:DNA-binding MarR family transcriptional regulator
MPTETNWLNPSEDCAWRIFVHAHDELEALLHRLLLQNFGLTGADYKVLAVFSEHSTGRICAQDLRALLQWEKSRPSHQVRGTEEEGLIIRESNPADGRSAMICLLPAGAAPLRKLRPST